MSLKKNVIANYLGQGWMALMSLAFVPLYIRYLGMEAYGLIGLFAMLQAWLTLLDMGMTPTLSREMARFSGGARDAQFIRDLLRTIEIIGLVVASAVALGVWMASDWLATDWLRAEKLPVHAVARAFALMGVVTSLRFIENIYRSSIVGLQRQVLLNVATAIMATLRGLGAVGVLAWISPSIGAFFIWQGLISILTVAVFAAIAYRTLPTASGPARFSGTALAGIWRFAAGMMTITFLSLLLTQIDRILLSRLLTLEAFGYYAFAKTVATGLCGLAAPVTQAIYPRFTELVSRSDQALLVKTYHRGAQLITVLMGAAAIMLILFGETILRLWTGDAMLSQRLSPLLAILAVGTLLNGLMHMPYQLQLAHGWTRLTRQINIVAVAVLVPAILWVTPRYGTVGAAWVWVALNAGYVTVGVYLMHRRLIPREKRRWYLQDIAVPLAAAASTAILLRWVLLYAAGPIVQLAGLLISGALVLAAAGTAAPAVRQQIAACMPRRIRSLYPRTA